MTVGDLVALLNRYDPGTDVTLIAECGDSEIARVDFDPETRLVVITASDGWH